jgi:hypothetical protein
MMDRRPELRRLRSAALAAALLALLPAPARADAPPARGLPEGWTFGDLPPGPDGQPRRTYRAPADRRGTYLSGASGDIPDAPGWDRAAEEDACYARTGRYDYSSLPAEEYWYFEADGEGLLLLRAREYTGFDADCRIVIRTTDSVTRVLISPGGFTRFIPEGGGWRPETHHFAAYRYANAKDIGIGNAWPRLAYFVVRKQRLSDSRVGGKIGKSQTHCVGYSSPPDAGGQMCWLAGRGPGRGIVTFDMELIAGGPNLYQHITEAEDGVTLDGRLFDWDRVIAPPSS